MTVGYVSDRHLMMLLLCGIYATTGAIWELPSRISAWLQRRDWTGIAGSVDRFSWGGVVVSLLLLGAMVAASMPKALETLHSNRAGYHAAGLWLAQHSKPVDVIQDDHCWAHFYAGRVFQEGKTIANLSGAPPQRFVVVGRRDKEIILTSNRDKPPDEKEIRDKGGQIVWSWPEGASPEEAAVVVVYALAQKQ
jgi:hypothetical protein